MTAAIRAARAAFDAATNERYAAGKARRDALEARVKETGAALAAIPGVGSGAMGLTPDAVRARPDYRTARQAADSAFQDLRRFNDTFVKQFAAEIRAERKARGR